MSSYLCLTRELLGLDARIECAVRPMVGRPGLWSLICVAGQSGRQPTAIKSQGPFYGWRAAQQVLDAVASALVGQGYRKRQEPLIWQLHVQGEVRKLSSGASGLSRRN